MRYNNLLRRIFLFPVILCLALGGMPLNAVAAAAQETVTLSSPEDLLALAESCVSDAWSRNKVVVLENDIDLSGVDFTAIPTFGGTFRGRGHTVSGLHITADFNALGFFRYLQKTARVENLHLEGTVEPSGSGNLDIGGLVGINNGTVKNCTFSGTVTGTERIGGIAGRNTVSGTVEVCRVAGIISGDHYIGGLVGENQGVIRNCVNKAQVNTQVDHNSVSAVMSGLSLDSFTVRESIFDATNIGGIAGGSSGVIRSCTNRASIGYEKMGYNVGGIAGSQIGYITECENRGVVSGSNGVGGIVGQFKPNAVLSMGENHMSQLTEQTTEMLDSMSGLMGSMSGMMSSMTANMERLEASKEILENPENWDPDTVDAAMNEISSAFNGMYQDMMASGSAMTGQMQSVMDPMVEMVDTMEKLNEGLNIRIIDISKEDTPENIQAKVNACANYAPVTGEIHVGGIVGIADVEDTTAREEIEGQVTFSSEGEMVMRLVIRDCRNLASVSAAKQYAGGIVGHMAVGAVFHGMNTGNIDSLSADYVGGIAGNSETYIASCFSRAVMAGNQYVGGIAGYGTEVADCYTITDIAAAAKFAGGILGYTDSLPSEAPGLVLNNHYYLEGGNYGGIDGICYEGATAPMTVGEFLQTDGLDGMFRTVTVRFLAEGQEAAVRTVELGKSLPLTQIPQLDVRENELYQWELRSSVTSKVLGMGETPSVQHLSPGQLSNLLFDQTYEAVFAARNTAIASRKKTESGRPLALAVGTFDHGATLRLTDITAQEPTVNEVEVLENWSVTVTDAGIEKLHYHMPQSANGENLVLYVRDSSGNWAQRDFTVEGSYLIFPFIQGETGFALEALPEEGFPAAAAAIGAGAVLLLLLLLTVRRIINRSRKKGSVHEAG